MQTSRPVPHNPAVVDAAVALIEAAEHRRPCPPIRALLDAPDAATAYAVQRLVTEHALSKDRRLVGRKIGLTAPAVQAQLGVDQPDFGVLFSDMQAPSDSAVSLEGLLQPRIEAEVAFVLAADLTGDITTEKARAAVGSAVAALEIVDSRIAGWDITLADTIADNASCGMFVLGDEPTVLGELDLCTISMTMVDQSGTVVSSGTGRDCLGDPIRALVWLAQTSERLGDPLRAGEVVLSGALGPMVAVVGAGSYRAELLGLGAVSVTFDGTQHQ